MPENTAPSRLAREFRRLYGPAPAQAPDTAGGVRALVLEVARPAEWQPLGALWKGVQADLGLPAPAIAANGQDGLQLWFSLAEPLDAVQAQAFLEGLRLRYLADVPRHRVVLLAAPVPPQVPARVNAQASTSPPAEDHWSAFVAADLAPIFEDTPWLDLPPSEEGQADLLSRLGSIQAAPYAAAWARLQPKPIGKSPTQAAAPGSTAHAQAAHFLLTVMNDDTAPLALRIEAAKALLPYAPSGH